MTKLPIAFGLVLLQAAVFAAAQAQPTDKARTDPATLAGPSIPDTEPYTLVVYEYGGQLQDLGVSPAEAALELLDLDDQTAARVAGVLTERSILAEQLIIDNFELVSRGEAIDASGSKLAKGAFIVQIAEALFPLTERGMLEDEIRPLLPETVAEEYAFLLDQYWRAVGKSRVETARAKGDTLRLRKAVREARAGQLEIELKLAAERALESERFTIDYLLKGLELSDAQQDRMKAIVIDFEARTMGDASEKDKQRLFIEVLGYLNQRQRDTLIDRIHGN
jgi:hypothetical protein